MPERKKTAISPTRSEDFPEWYQQVVKVAELAENSPVRGCMVIKPWGYSLWENIQHVLDEKFKATGHKNAYFPLFIPLSFLQKEAEHVEGFAKECAVVTHHRLEVDQNGKLQPAGELEEPLVIRPTSETIIGAMFAQWVQSYRDLPLLINQWANIVRWEMRTRLFLRTTEFLWQEGHTVHATSEEAKEETMRMLEVYTSFARDYLALPVIKGEKTPEERFPGAVSTYTIEAMMQDRKALQAGTSHFLGQNFSRASGIKFLDENGKLQYAWTTSWGVSTRLIGAVVMAHGDDYGLVLPPKLAPCQVVILPVIHRQQDRNLVLDYCQHLLENIKKVSFSDQPVRVEIDTSAASGGEKVWNWIKKGVPILLEIGPREVNTQSVFVGRRDMVEEKRYTRKTQEFVSLLPSFLGEIQENIYQRALKFRENHTVQIANRKDFYDFFTPVNKDKPEIHGGFALCYWAGNTEIANQLKEDLGVSIRCLPLEDDPGQGKCIFTGQMTNKRVIFAKAY